jgi:hypothetical protein
MYSPETDARIAQLRAIRQERPLTTEENIEAIRLIREGRVGASYASAGAKAAKAKPDPQAVMDKLKGFFAKADEKKES